MPSRPYRKSATPDVIKRYATDLSDQEFDLIAPHVAQKEGSGKKRTVDIREVLNAIFYRIRAGCQWRMLPSDFPAWYHVWYYYQPGAMTARGSTLTRSSAARCEARPGEIPNQVLGLLTVRA
jgi:putative transposase